MNLKFVIITVTAVAVTGCATARRGVSSNFTVITTPPGATVLTSVETIESRKQYDWRVRKAALQTGDLPDFKYYKCEPTPCSMNIPRRREFSMLITKDGYKPVVATPDRMHNKKAAKLAKLQTGVSATTAVATAGGVTAAANTTMAAGAFISGGAAAAAVAIVVAGPALIVMGSAAEADQRTGAKYDFVPNPMSVTLVLEDNEVGFSDAYTAFDSLRHAKSLDPVEADMCYIGNTRMTCFEMKRIHKNRAKAARR